MQDITCSGLCGLVWAATHRGTATCMHVPCELGWVVCMLVGQVIVWEWNIMPMGLSPVFTMHGSGTV